MPKPLKYRCAALGRMIAAMPEDGLALDHRNLPDEPFDHTKSPLLRWLLQQHAVHNYIVSRLSGIGLIVFDESTGRWIPNLSHPDVCHE